MAIRVEERQVPLARQEIEIRSDLKQLRQAREFVRAFCRDLPGPPLDEESVAALELAVNEAASNIMKHAYHGRDRSVDSSRSRGVSGPCRRSGCIISGIRSTRRRRRRRALDGSRESGFGAYIISRSVDQVRYYRDERGRNCVALMKTRKCRRKSET